MCQSPTSLPLAPKLHFYAARIFWGFELDVCAGTRRCSKRRSYQLLPAWCTELVVAVGEITSLSELGSQMEDVGEPKASQMVEQFGRFAALLSRV